MLRKRKGQRKGEGRRGGLWCSTDIETCRIRGRGTEQLLNQCISILTRKAVDDEMTDTYIINRVTSTT
jgi:hypothetical protein